MSGTPPLHERLIARHRCKQAKGLSDLEALSRAYAEKAAYHGSKGPWWRVWRAIERARGHRLRAAIETLPATDRRWFAKWSFERKRLREGIVAYRRYLADPGGIGPFDLETAEFLRHVIAVYGPLAALAEAHALPPPAAAGPHVGGIVTELLARHRPSELLERSPEPAGARLHDGPSWARRAIALAKQGDDAAAAVALDRAAKLGIDEGGPELERVVLGTFALTPEAWAERRKAWSYPDVDHEAAWRENPGARIARARGDSLHAWGGADYALPSCKACGHQEHQFLILDVPSIPDLAARLSGWPKLPLFACIDCAVQLTRRDYQVAHADRRIETIAVGAENIASLGNAHGTLEPIPRVPIDVAPIGLDAEPGADRTQIGGEPDWVQDIERVFCPRCWNELVFVAALGSTYGDDDWLVPNITINNGSGYQYFFACAPCGVLSVFGQNT